MLPGSHNPPLAHVATNLVVGKSGAAKSRLLKRIESLRPQDERWAFLVTDSDQHTVPPELRLAHSQDAGAQSVAALTGGCICCTGSVELRSTLVRLLRQARPQRLIIEAPAMASTRELIRLLSDPWLAPVLDLKAVVLALDANEVFPEDEADKERLAYAAAIATTGPNEKVADAKVVENVDLSVLDLPGPEKPKARFQSGVG